MKQRKQTAGDMMTLGGEGIPRPVRKKGRLRLKAKQHRRLKKGLAAASAVAIVVGGTFGINALFFNKAAPNTVAEGFDTICLELPTDGSTPDLHSALENIGYMNARFQAQDVWYSEMQGSVNTMLSQQVNTWKQYSDGVLIQTDITTSSLINSAKQFCWVGDRVIWREAAGGPSTYDGIDTAWKDGAPYGNMSVEDYKVSRGLPGTAFSVYVINEETLLDASEVTANGDGTYTQTYHLDPATDKAPAYYVNQMMYTGGLTSLPTFDYITVTYTFDATWQVLSSEIEEAYTATKGVNAKCTATYSTQYEYGTDRAYSTAYDDYFKSYADKPATGAPTEQELTAADCLAEAFGTVLTQPVTFSLQLTLNGQPFEGLVYVDASDTSALSLRARIGEVFLQYAGEDVFLRYGDGVKVKLSVSELTALISSLTEGEEVQTMASKEGGISFDTDELLAQLGSGSFTVAEDKRSATLSSELSLMGLQLPVTFRFLVGEDGAVTLGDVAARLTLGNTELGATLAFSQEELPALTEQEAAGYVPLMPYVQNVLSVLSGEALRVGVSYQMGDLAVEGSLDVMTDELCVQGTLTVAYKSAKKELSFLFADGTAYLAVDGIRIKADVTEALALLGNFVELPEMPELPDVSALDFGQLVSTALSPEFAALFAVSEADNALSLAVKGTELLKAFGVDFALGDVQLSVEEGEISAAALGAELTLTAGEAFSYSTDGYVDGVALAKNVLALLQNDYLCADIAYAAGELAVSGTVTLDVNKLAAKGTLVLNYKSATKTVGVLYADGAVYVEVEGIRLTANVEELVSLIGSLLGKDVTLDTPEGDLIEQVLSLNFAELVSISEGETSVEILLKGTELLKAFGIDFALGDVQLSVTEGEISAAALGAELTLTAGEAFSFTTDGYVDGVKLAQNVLTLLQNDYLCADIAYAAGNLAVSGTVTVDMNALAAKGTLVLNYKSATKTVGVLYADGAVYVEVEGIKLTANVEELVALIGSLLGKDVTLGTPEGDLIEQVLSMNFAELVSISEGETSVEILLKGTELLKAFGIDFALGDVALSVMEGEISASALGAELTLTAGEAFSYSTDGYVDGVALAKNVLALLQNDYLCADIAYAAGELAVSGTVMLDMNALAAKGTLVLNYKSATKTVGILYADGAVYVEVEGIKLTANVEELVSLIGSLLGKDVTLGTPEGDLIEQVLSLNFAELVSISEGETSVEILLKGTELLKAFGVDFALGDVALSVAEGEISAAALGAELTLTAGEAFTYTTDGYVDGVKLAQNILALLQNDYLCADIAYAAGELAVSGTVTLDMNALAAKGTLVLNYKSATKTVGVLYADGAVYVEVEGIRLTANVEELVALIGSLLGKDVTLGTPEGDLIEQVLSLNFAELVSVSEGETSVEILLKGTELLKAFGVDFALGDVQLSVAEGEISAAALGAELTLTAGEAFSFTTDGYVDGVALAKNVLALLQNDYLCADIAYAAGELAVSGTVTVDMNALAAKGTLVLNYKSATKTVGVLYADGAVYVEVEGIRLTANVEELVALIGSLLGKDVTLGTPEGDLLEQVLSLNFAELVSISEGETSVEILLKGTELLKAFGIDFALGDVALSVEEGEISASALGAELTLTAGEAFTFTTDGYVDGVALAKNVLALLQNDYLCADVAYAAGNLAVSGTVTLDVNKLAAKGTLVLNYKSATKTVGVLYADGAVYVEVEGIRLTANVEELVSLIGSLLGKDVTLGTPEGDLIEQVLSLNFAELVSISEGETSVEILLKGTELLQAFGIDFALGDVALSVEEGEISAAALGAELTLTAGEAFTYTTDGYVDGVKLAQNVLTLLQNDYLCADIAYAAGELAVSGTVTLDVNKLAAKGTLVLNYKSATKTVGVLYADGAVYVEVEGIKLTANVEELVALIGSLLGKDVTLGTPEGDLIEQVLSLNFAELVSISEGETSVEILLKGTELLKAFGIDFALGDVALSVMEGEISAAALGAELTLTAGEAFSFTTDGYVDGVALAKNVLALLQNDYLCADIAYAAGELAVSGTVMLDMNALAAKGTLVLNYKSATKTVGILYADGAVYVEVEGIKLTANVEELVALIGSLLGKDVTLGTPEGDLIEQVLSMNFAELVSISEGETSVEILLKGTELLKAFGIDFALGDVALSVEEGEISAAALGADLTLTAGEAFTYTTDGYVELAPVFDLVKTVLTDGRIALGGSLKLKYKNMAAEVAIENGVLSWKDGFALSLDLTVIANGTRQTIKVSADASQLRLVYGSVGVALGYDELYKLSDTFEAVYERVARTIRSYVAGADIPATAEELMNTLGAGAAVTEIFASVGLPSLIDGVHFGGATGTEGSMGTVTLGGFTFDLIMQNGAFSLALAESKAGDVTLSGKVDIAASGRLPDAPAGTPEESGLMTADDLCELLDFVGAAVGTLASQDVTVSFAGGTKNADNEDVYNISGQLVYHAGASGKVVTIDVDGKSIVVDPTMYLVFRLVLEDKRTEGNDLYLDFWMFDAEGDGELDFFVSISKYPGKTYADDGETRLDQPLCFRVPAGDILTLLASGVSLTEGKLSGFLTGLGLPADAVDAVFSTLDAFFGSRWLTDTDKAQLGALGNVLMSTLGIDAKLEGILSELNSAIGGALDDAAAVDPGKYLSELGIRRDEKGVTFFLTLNSDLIYGGNGLAPLTIELTKTQAVGGESLLSGVLLGNVWGNKNTETTGISFGFAFGKTQLSASSADAQLTAADGTKLASLALEQFQSYTFKGVDELIKAIAASATYPVADGEYALNEKFIVEGTASASLDIFGGIDLTGIGVQLAVSLKENGSPVVNIRISYEKYSFILPVINSDGVTDLTIEDGMVYVRRTAGGETTYRVAPLGKFFAGFLTEHLAYLFNFSDTIADAIKKAETSGGGSSSGDYGAVLGNILSSYSYAPSGSGKAASWSLTLNGNSLTNGALTDILLTLGTDEEGILRTLNVDTSLIDLIRLSLPLTFQNPCGESYPDPTTNVKDLLSGADLASVDWNAMAENAYLAPQTSTVSYAVDGVQVGSQQVWYSGDMLLTALARPDLAAWQKEGYTLSWKDFAFTPNGVCEAVYSPNLYPVTITAPVNLGGDWTDNSDGTYSFTTQMYYGEALTLTWGSKTHVFRVGTDNNVFDLGAAIGEDSVVWEDAVCDIVANGSTITVPLTPDTVVYTSSSVAFTLDGTSLTGQSTAEFNAQYTLLTPTAEGYTFLGWYKTEDGELTRVTELAYQGGGNVTTVSAMWVSNLSDAAITIERSGSWFSYDQRISFRAEGGKVVGEYAGHFTVSASYELTFKWNTVSYDVDTSDFTPYETTSGWQTGVATSHTPVADPTARLTFTVSVLLNGQSVGATSVYAEKK